MRPYLRVTTSEGLLMTEAEDTCDFIRRADRSRDHPPDWCCSADPGRTSKLDLNLLNWRLTIFDVITNSLRAPCKAADSSEAPQGEHSRLTKFDTARGKHEHGSRPRFSTLGSHQVSKIVSFNH